MCGEHCFQTERRKVIFFIDQLHPYCFRKVISTSKPLLQLIYKLGTVYEDVCLGATGQLVGQSLSKVHHISCTKVTTKLLKDIVLGKYCQLVCITLLHTFSLRRKHEFHNHLQHVLCNVFTHFHLEKHYYCYAGLYTLGPSDFSLAFDVNRKTVKILPLILY